MQTVIDNKSQKTRDRIEKVKSCLRAHKKNIKVLNTNFQYRLQLCKRGKLDGARIVSYDCIPYSEERYYMTQKNLKDQMALLEAELVILIEYGA